eukprot:PITA_22064
MLDIIPSVISQRRNETLEAKATKYEVKKVLFDMDLDKAPRPDGFSTRFLQACWPIFEEDVLKMVQKSQNTQKIGGSTNSAFLALIPKEKGTNNFNRFRSISLCNTRYKLITKVIANRLKLILPKIIPENQGGFIQGRKIVDNFILVQEAIHSSLLRKEQDDTLLLGPASISSTIKFKAVLDEFSEALGSIVNKRKCHIFNWNITPTLLSTISRCLGFAASSAWSSFKYLGLPVSHKRPASKDWLPQLEKFKVKIQAWGYS